MLRLLFASLLLVFSYGLFSQELPPIQNYTPKNYDGEYQNWGIAQSSSKLIYIANHSSLLEFDGRKWRSYKLPAASIIRSVEVVHERIYTGSYREFGYWTKDETGQLNYISLSDRLDSPVSMDEEFWDILAHDHWVLFQSLDRIYIYDLFEREFRIIEAKSAKAKLHKLRDKVYFQKARKGLFTLEKGEPVLVSDHPVLKSQSVIGLYEYQGKLLMITDNAKWYLYDFNSLTPFKTDMDSLDLRLYSSIKLMDGTFVLGSISNGFFHLDQNGRQIRNVDQSKGLNNNTVLSLFEDADNNLWLGLDNGISVVNLYSPFNEYIDKLGKLGVVYAALNHNGYLYLGTNQGLFVRRTEGEGDFKLIKGTQGQVWSLQYVHQTIFCGHNSGTFVIQGDQATLVSDFRGTWGVKPIDQRADLVIQGNYNGLSVLEKEDDHWSLRNVVEGFDTSSRFFEINNLDVVINHEQKGLFHLVLDSALQKVVKVDNVPPISHSSNLFQFHDQLYYKTFTGIYRIDETLKDITLDSTMTDLVFKENQRPISILIPDTIGQRVWYFTENGIKYIYQSSLSGKLNDFNISIPNTLSTNLGVSGFENISKISDSHYLIGSSNGYISLDLEKVNPSLHQIAIHAIQYGDYQNISTKTHLRREKEFKYLHNNLKFQYGVAEYDKYTDVKYQYKLEGLYKQWSQWSETPEVTFMNLPFGEYTFSVRGLAGNNLTTNTAQYSFTVARPWYLSFLALTLYALSLVLLFFVIHRIYKRHYRKKQEALILNNKKELERRNLQEKERISHILNEKLQNEIESKNRELAISTMSILKKNKFLSSIKSQLNSIPEKDKQLRLVLREIDRNINSEDDWKFFEDAFNNADKDFLNRIKSKHANLTNNDLRLCAYLRLNLSSKEIAPLLNISVKSVEMKRYRIRKKLKLPHQDNLTDYILNF
ncbi:triple tyrosine motif-containing protein [Galbibacter sp.]|uniref:triple tyrosine motif-containing protein n=1 Tax=Galbibacter sp. TaxID=2918471 RepID=UPI002B63BF52|nr:triple tyrosine motif-containing protein [Galbibacter sp.]HLV63112.1 triple tyrosine motif-containing protein [Galbibacter sp.]